MSLQLNSKRDCHVQIVIFGASGDLAAKKLYPALYSLYVNNNFSRHTHFLGFGRSNIQVDDIKVKCESFFVKKEPLYEEQFWALNTYISGDYNDPDSFEDLNNAICEIEATWPSNYDFHRLFYLAIPPDIYDTVTSFLSLKCKSKSGWTRIIVEKPFGRDSLSSEKLSKSISRCFEEEEIYRIDHYLGKEMVQNLLTVRFANRIFDATWNNEHISSVIITFKEPIGIENRGSYFDSYGIIRDVLQNHLVQIFTLIAMDEPDSLLSNDIRKRKIQILRDVEIVTLEDTVIGQYEGYTDNSSVLNKKSKTATYAAFVFRVQNRRWQGVPFILKCGKGLNERKAEIRVQYKSMNHNIFEEVAKTGESVTRNELVLRIQPGEAIYCKCMTKPPGIHFQIQQSELDLTYKHQFPGSANPEAYERLILEALDGSQTNFVSSEELEESWRILTPVLHQFEKEGITPYIYAFGSRGPSAADILIQKNGYVYSNSCKRILRN